MPSEQQPYEEAVGQGDRERKTLQHEEISDQAPVVSS